MSYKRNNKNIAIVVLAFATFLAISKSSFAEDVVPLVAPQAQESTAPDLFDTADGGNELSNELLPDLSGETAASETGGKESGVTDSNALITPQENTAPALPENNESVPTEPVVSDNADISASMNTDLTAETAPAVDGMPDNSDVASANDSAMPQSGENNDEVLPTVEAPKSPFESFGNAILSKVDNDLFNQMSDIEKQTTLLNLELKREDVKNRIEALKIQRQKAREEEAKRKSEEEEKAKEAELERQLRLREAEERLREKEIELEKVRQAKILNEYMNEMLMVNQNWIEKNSELHARISKLEEERASIIADFENKMNSIDKSVSSSISHAEEAKTIYNKVISSYVSQISTLKENLANVEAELRNTLQEDEENPFSENELEIDQNSIDMSEQYAIMDITGKGKDIVAKIVGKDGTTFIVHKGSMLKGGEVVTAITDNFVAFDKKGQKGFLYTGGTVMEYEPTVAFNNAGKTQRVATPKTDDVQVIRNVRGTSNTNLKAEEEKSVNTTNNNRNSNTRNKKSKRKDNSNKSSTGSSSVGSLASGMFVK